MATSNQSIIDLCNRALSAIGARTTIAGFPPGDDSVEAQQCAILVQSTFEQLARTAQWNCLRNQTSLTLLMAAIGTPENVNGNTYPQPPSPWLYAYVYPSDCLAIRWLVPSLPVSTPDGSAQTTINNLSPIWMPNGGQIPYAISYSPSSTGAPEIIVLTNQSQAQAVYTVNQPNPQTWDSLFQQAFVGSLAAYLVPALSLSLPLMQLSIKTAEMAIVQARAADGNEGVTTMDHLPDWMKARNGAQGYGLGYNNWGGNCYSDMCWPAFN